MNDENRCIAFLKEYRANPEQYLPLTEKQYKHFDEWEEQIVRNLCWGAGILEGNRPYFMELWKIFGVSTMTVSVVSDGIEPAEIVRLLQSSGLVECTDPEKAKINIKKFTEDGGKTFYGVNTVIGKEDDDTAEQYVFWNGPTCRFDELNVLNEVA